MSTFAPKLLVLMTLVSVAPVAAEQPTAGRHHDASDCPYARAETAADADAMSAGLSERAPPDGFLLDPGRRSAFISP